MKLKIVKDFIIKRLPAGVESWARAFVWIFGMVLAILTVITVLPFLTHDTRFTLLIALILFLIATTIVFIFEARRRFLPRSTGKQEDGEIPVYTKHPSRNRWIVIGILALAVIILVPIFAKQRLPDPQEYQAFLTAFTGVGAWVIGIALAVFAYQQYKLRQTEHRLLFEPQVILTSGNISITGLTTYPFLGKQEPFQIKWTVFVQNTSQIPILIEHMQVYVKPASENGERQTSLTPTYCHVSEPDNLRMPFEVTLSKPQHIVWIVEGSAGDVFDYVSGDSGKRDFMLMFRVFAKRPQDLKEPIFYKETVSWPIHVPKDANWVSKTPFLDKLDKYRKEQEGD